jgi:hypothetical protein
MLISDTLKLMTQTDPNEDITELGCLKRILPSSNNTGFYSDFYIYS